MQIICILSIALFLLISIFWEKNLFCPAVIFNATWLVVTVFAALQLYDLHAVSQHTYLMVLIGVFSFNAGFLLRKSVHVTFKKNTVASTVLNEYQLNYKFLIVFYFLITIFTAFLASKSIRLILSGTSMETIRFNYSNIESGMVIKSAIGFRFEMYVVAAAEFAAIALLPVTLFEDKCREKWILFGELSLFLVLHLFVTGARSFIIDIIILFVIYFLMNGCLQQNIFRKMKKMLVRIKTSYIIGVVLLMCGAVGLVIVMTMLRKGDRKETSIFREIYRYFAISFPLFDVRLDITNDTTYTHGWALIYGLVRPVLSMLHAVGLPFPEGLDHAMQLINSYDDFYYVGGGKANSFVTVFYYHYTDFGLFSLILYSIVYGYAAQCVYSAVKRSPNTKNQTFYLIIAIGLFLTFARSLFAAFRYVYAFFILAAAFKRKTIAQEVRGFVSSVSE